MLIELAAYFSLLHMSKWSINIVGNPLKSTLSFCSFFRLPKSISLIKNNHKNFLDKQKITGFGHLWDKASTCSCFFQWYWWFGFSNMLSTPHFKRIGPLPEWVYHKFLYFRTSLWYGLSFVVIELPRCRKLCEMLMIDSMRVSFFRSRCCGSIFLVGFVRSCSCHFRKKFWWEFVRAGVWLPLDNGSFEKKVVNI